MTATDLFLSHQASLDSPYTKAAAITKSDADELSFVTRAIYVGGAGDISVILADDTAAVLLKAVPVGTLLRIRAKQVKATDTTASLLIALA